MAKLQKINENVPASISLRRSTCQYPINPISVHGLFWTSFLNKILNITIDSDKLDNFMNNKILHS